MKFTRQSERKLKRKFSSFKVRPVESWAGFIFHREDRLIDGCYFSKAKYVMESSFIKFADFEKDFDLLCGELLKDITVIQNEMKKDDTQTWRRLYVRSLVSVLESQTTFLRKHIAITGELDYLGLSEEEAQILFKMNKDKKQVRYNKLSLEQYIVFVLEIFASVNHSFISIDKKSKGYNYLGVLIRTRHRITHPGSFPDLSISDKEIKICEQAFLGYQNMLVEVMDSSMKALKRTAEGLEKAFAA